MSKEEEEAKIKLEQYTKFADDIRIDYEKLQQAVEETKTEISEYEELRTRLLAMTENKTDLIGDSSMVDLGHQKVYCRAAVDDFSCIFVHVGFGFHVELEVQEAVRFVNKRTTLLKDEMLARRSTKCDAVRDHLRSTEMLLDELSRLKR